jgi:glycosyltransferase involved in cell wall biosynthesis
MSGYQPWESTSYFFNAMDIYAFPSYKEAFGAALIEAMSCAVPSIARKNEGSVEIINNNINGYLIDTNKELYKALHKLTINKNLRVNIGKNGRESVQNRYSWQAITQQTLEVYRSIQ